MNKWVLTTLLASSLALTGCQSAYYGAMEKVGYHKRDILVDRVEDSRDAQVDAEEQFQSALEQLKALNNFEKFIIASNRLDVQTSSRRGSTGAVLRLHILVFGGSASTTASSSSLVLVSFHNNTINALASSTHNQVVCFLWVLNYYFLI